MSKLKNFVLTPPSTKLLHLSRCIFLTFQTRTAHLGEGEIWFQGLLPKNCPEQTLNTEQPQGKNKTKHFIGCETTTSKTCYQKEWSGKNVTFSGLSPCILGLSKTSQMLAKWTQPDFSLLIRSPCWKSRVGSRLGQRAGGWRTVSKEAGGRPRCTGLVSPRESPPSRTH